MASCAEDGPPRFGIVVGEASGDILGADLMQALLLQYPGAIFEGVGGPQMESLGFRSLFPQDRLAVMGLVEPLKRLPELLRIRKSLKQHFVANPPAAFIGIDAPDFNLNLEMHLRSKGIKTVHYVSPSVWAWRQGRIHTISKAVDLMLTLFPFEQRFYQDHGVPVRFVGHPLADRIPLEVNSNSARSELGLLDWIGHRKVVALLPGSRASEVSKMGELFLQTARLVQQELGEVCFLLPSANASRHQQLEQLVAERGDGIPLRLVAGNSHAVMAAADVVLMASGTTSLEGMLLKKPLVIAYKVAPLTYHLLKRLVKVRFIGLPNLLAGTELVPEFIQDRAEASALAAAVTRYFVQPDSAGRLQQAFTEQHLSLRCGASVQAAMAIKELIA